MLSEILSNQTPAVNENEAFWKKHIALLTTSQMTRKEYCRRYDVNYDRFGYWLGRLHDKKELVAVKLKTVEENPMSTTLCNLRFVNGTTLYIHTEAALSLILERMM